MATQSRVLDKSHTGTGVDSNDVIIRGRGFLSVRGTFSGAVRLLRSPDGGANFVPVSVWSGSAFVDVSLTAPGTVAIEEPEELGAPYKTECTAYTSGTIVTRVKRGKDML